VAAGPVLAFWLVALLLIVVPGADWAFTISAGLRGQSVLPAVGGLVAGYAAVTAIVSAGVGAAVAGSPAVLTGLTIAGGLYLTWHGALTFAHPAVPTALIGGPQADGPQADGPQADGRTRVDWGTFVKGVGVSGLNPKGLLIFLALLPQFTNAHGSWPVAGQIAVLGLAFMLTCAGFYFILGSVARTVLTARPAIARTVSRCSGLAMALIGIALLLDHFVP
jgi:threonine/homoserine/homoserine lactone efflux protein